MAQPLSLPQHGLFLWSNPRLFDSSKKLISPRILIGEIVRGAIQKSKINVLIYFNFFNSLVWFLRALKFFVRSDCDINENGVLFGVLGLTQIMLVSMSRSSSPWEAYFHHCCPDSFPPRGSINGVHSMIVAFDNDSTFYVW